MQLEDFDFDIVYKEGRLNSNANALSRITVDTVDIAVIQIQDILCDLTSEEILDAQLQKPIVNKLQQVLDGETETVKKTNSLWPFLSNFKNFSLTKTTSFIIKHMTNIFKLFRHHRYTSVYSKCYMNRQRKVISVQKKPKHDLHIIFIGLTLDQG